ncbi:MAG: DNA/RNA nuclease SfsA [Treponema sp.]|nr:DNA/RNA nuclease SfsA [Treponema sp.]
MRVELFANDREALFIRRPNRFLIIAGDENTGEELACHCPNPGRLIEFVFPGARLILEKRAGKKGGLAGEAPGSAKTAYSAVGIYYRGRVAPLFSSRANMAAEKLILKKIIPNIREIRPEYTLGPSRFDFLCIDGEGRRHLVEVKACSLVEYSAAMFPDAPSGRALKHLEELAALSAQGYCCHVLFVIVHGAPQKFIPNLHTDPLFAAALSRYGRTLPCRDSPAEEPPGGAVAIHAALLRCDREGRAVLAKSFVPVDLSHGELAGANRGNYLILLRLPERVETPVGSLGTVTFEAGWYVYAGSARKNLSQRISRHLRKVRKQKHWHLDYLTPYAGFIKALPIFSYRNLECALAEELRKLGGRPIPGFGSSDCDKKKSPRDHSHLCYFADPPMGNRAFVDMLLRYRHREGLIPAPGS